MTIKGMSPIRLSGVLDRWRARTAERRRLETERLGRHPRAGSWYVVDDLGHLYLNWPGDEPPPAKPVCGSPSVDGARQMDINAGDTVCLACDTYLHDVYLVQIG
jgi:hypothetical protein